MRTYRGVASIVFNHYTLHVESNIREWNFRRKRMYFEPIPLFSLKSTRRPDIDFLCNRANKSLKAACFQYAKARKGIYL